MDSIKIGSYLKFSIFICLVSLFLFVANIAWGSYATFFGWLFNSNPVHINYVNRLGIVFWAAHIGLTLRLIGIILGIVALFLSLNTLKYKNRIKMMTTVALFLEGLYFFLYLPFVPYLWRPGTYFLSINYLLQIFLTSPFLFVLSIKLKNYGNQLEKNLWKWSGLAFMTYIAALWVNALFRWFDMSLIEGMQFLFSGIIVLGLALILLGLHYIIYFMYSYMAGIMNFILLVDVWTIPLFFLGLLLLFERTQKN